MTERSKTFGEVAAPAARGQVLIFTIPGRPVPLERARVESFTLKGSGQRITKSRTPGKSIAYRQRVQLSMNMASAAGRRRWPLRTPAPLGLELFIFWEDLNHGDGSNLFKAIEDAGNGILWKDDKQIVEGYFRSSIDQTHPRVEVLVRIVEPGKCTDCEIWRHVGKCCPTHDDGRGLETVG